MTVKSLIATYGYWGEHPKYSLESWRSEIAEGITRLGYWQWIVHIVKDKTEG